LSAEKEMARNTGSRAVLLDNSGSRVERNRAAVKARPERAVEIGDGGIRSTTPEPPYLWIHKPALDAIRNRLDSTNSVTSAIAVYTVLCELASDKTSSTFETTQAWIAAKSGVCTRTLRNVLPVFVELGLLDVETADLKAPSTYSLLSIGIGCRTIGKREKRNTCHDLNEPGEVTLSEVSKETMAFLDLWSPEYRKAHGREYFHKSRTDTANDIKAAENLLATGLAQEVIMSIARKAWSKADYNRDRRGGFNCKKAASLPGFDRYFNEICEEVDFRQMGRHE
jgi:hypothetical protein